MTYSVHSSHELSFRTSAALRRRLALSCCLFLSVAAGASGQSLLELGSLVDDPLGVAEGADLFAARVDLDLVRSAPDRLELPTPDGRILVAELSVFEDRGNGDVMWAGGFPDWGFESVVLSVTEGRLVGRFGEPDGAKYRITTGPTGSGLLVDTAQIRRDPETVQCPGGVVPEDRGVVPAIEASLGGPAAAGRGGVEPQLARHRRGLHLPGGGSLGIRQSPDTRGRQHDARSGESGFDRLPQHGAPERRTGRSSQAGPRRTGADRPGRGAYLRRFALQPEDRSTSTGSSRRTRCGHRPHLRRERSDWLLWPRLSAPEGRGRPGVSRPSATACRRCRAASRRRPSPTRSDTIWAPTTIQ